MKGATYREAIARAFTAEAIPVIPFFCGGAVGLLAWAPFGHASIALVMPLLWACCTTKRYAFFLALGYHLAVVGFLPQYAGEWFESPAQGAAIWLAVGAISAVSWGLLRPTGRSLSLDAFSGLALFVVITVPPVALFLPGHPLIAVGLLFPGAGWWGVAGVLALFGLAGASAFWARSSADLIRAGVLSKQNAAHLPAASVVSLSALAICVALGFDASNEARLAADFNPKHHSIQARQTSAGVFPDDDEVIARVEQIRSDIDATRKASANSDRRAVKAILYPEGFAGLYEPGNAALFDAAIRSSADRSGITIVVGVVRRSAKKGDPSYYNSFMVFRPGAKSPEFFDARFTAPVASWRPWANEGQHMPANFLMPAYVTLGKLKARYLLCYEEYIPFLSLLGELLEPSDVVIALASNWPQPSAYAGSVQALHSFGMARLFSKQLVRAQNSARKPDGQ